MTDIAWIDKALSAARPQAVAALLRYFRDLDTAEEAFQEACLRALKNWPKNGPPRDPTAWLIFVGRNSGIDTIRKQSRLTELPPEDRISDLEDHEANMAERLDMQDLRFLSVAVTIQQQSGGNLAEILSGLAKVIRARFRLFRRVKAITAEAQWSGKFLSAFPLFCLGAIMVNDPGYYDEVLDHPYFIPACFVVGILLTANLIVMRVLTNIKV